MPSLSPHSPLPPPSFHSLQLHPHHDPAFKLFGQTIPVSSLPIDHDDRSATTSQDSHCATTTQEEDEELDVRHNSFVQTRRTTTTSFTSTTSNTDHQKLQDEEKMMRIIPTSGKCDASHGDEVTVGSDTDGEEDSSVVSMPTSAIICTDNFYIDEGDKEEGATMQTAVNDTVNVDVEEEEEEEEEVVVVVAGKLGASQLVHHDGLVVEPMKKPDKPIPCPRCKSLDTKFCYYNNYNVNQPRHFCKGCQRYWTAGGTLRNVPVGAGRRKSKQTSTSTSSCRSAVSTTAVVVNHVAQPTNPPPPLSSSSDVALINSIAVRSRADHHSPSCDDFPLTSSAAGSISSHSSSAAVYDMNIFARADPSGVSINLADRSVVQPPSILYNTSSICTGPASSSRNCAIPSHLSFDPRRDKANDSAASDPMAGRLGHDQMSVIQQQQDGRPSGDHLSWLGKFPMMQQQQQQQQHKGGANHDVKMPKGASTELEGVAATVKSNNINVSDNRTSTNTTFPLVVNNSSGAWPIYGSNLWAPPIHDGSAAASPIPNFTNFPTANATSGTAQFVPSSMYNNGWSLGMASPWPLIQGAMWPVPYCTAMWAMQWAAAASMAAAAAANSNPTSSSVGTANAAGISSTTNSTKGHNLQDGIKQQQGWKRAREGEVENGDVDNRNQDTNPTQQQKMERLMKGSGIGIASSRRRGGNDEEEEEGELVVPKTLRIGDPEAAAQSSIWATLGQRGDGYGSCGGGIMFEDLREAKVGNTTSITRAGRRKSRRNHGDGDGDGDARAWNPAAASRSFSFQESNLPCGSA